MVKLAARAEADIDAALAFLIGYSPRFAANWHAKLLTQIETLEIEPSLCPLAVEADRLGIELRELLFGKKSHVYRILFVVDDEAVHVLHVRHAARDWLSTEQPE